MASKGENGLRALRPAAVAPELVDYFGNNQGNGNVELQSDYIANNKEENVTPLGPSYNRTEQFLSNSLVPANLYTTGPHHDQQQLFTAPVTSQSKQIGTQCTEQESNGQTRTYFILRSTNPLSRSGVSRAIRRRRKPRRHRRFCSDCNASFPLLRQLEDHMIAMHLNKPPSVKDNKSNEALVKNTQPQQKAKAIDYRLISPIVAPTPTIRYRMCIECGLWFPLDEYNAHLELHRLKPLYPRQYACLGCHIQFFTSEELTAHAIQMHGE
uniref:Zinc finger protein n=1 Tax=Ciona intestinalis TaxID=7719 RepID=F6X723_CIOIN